MRLEAGSHQSCCPRSTLSECLDDGQPMTLLSLPFSHPAGEGVPVNSSGPLVTDESRRRLARPLRRAVLASNPLSVFCCRRRNIGDSPLTLRLLSAKR